MSLDDERVRFYLRNGEQIETWAALRSEAAAAVDEWLAGLDPYVRELVPKLGDGVVLRAATGENNPYPSFRLTRASWPVDPSSEDAPASVCLEWARGRTTLRPPATPYVGLRSPKTDPLGVLLREADALKKIRAARKDVTSPWWIGYGYVRPSSKFIDAPDEYREALLNALRTAWAAYAPAVDEVQRNRSEGR